jgi:hypothetical protein
MTRPSVKSPLDLSVLMLVAVALGFLATSCAAARASDRVCRIPQRVVHHPHGVLQAKFANYATPYFYEVAPQLQGESDATYHFRRAPEYAELLDLRGYARAARELRGVLAPSQQGTGQAVDSDTPAEPEPPEGPAKPHEAATSAASSADAADAFTSRYPVLAASCMKCHTGDEPKGGVWIDGTDPFEADDLARLAAAVVNGRMPKNHAPLAAQVEYELLVELFTEHAD